MSTVNPAVAANLKKVLSAEQHRAALRMAWVRFIAAVAATVIIWLPIALGTLSPQVQQALRPTSYGALLFVALSSALLWVTKRVPRLGQWASLAVAVVDIPTLSAIQHIQQSRLPFMWQGIPTNVGFMCGLVALSVLSLSKWVPFAAAAVATASIMATLVRAGMPFIPMALTGLVPFLIAFIGSSVVGRLRTLVAEARKSDLVGKYILGERLGAGGMAEVFLATYSPEGGFERKVAVKRILPSFATHADSVALFRREAELGALLAHPNIVQVLDFGAHEGTYFLAMEYVEGIPLSRLLVYLRKRNERLPLPGAVYVALMLAEATDYIHTRTSPTGSALALVHRDLNPPNVLLSTIGEVKLSDFGIARASTQEQLTATGVVRGKIGYCAPEQLKGEAYDSRADLFSLGATLHELLTSEKLFTGTTELALFNACLLGPIAPPSAKRPEVPPALDAVVMGLLERDKERRTQSAAELLRQLRQLPGELGRVEGGRGQLRSLVAQRAATDKHEAVLAAVQSAGTTDPGGGGIETQTASVPGRP